MLKRLLLLAAATLLASAQALAANVSFTGSLAHDDEGVVYAFELLAPTTVTLRTWSYAGGVNAASSLIGAGGFDPIVTLFTAAGDFIADNDDGSGVDTDPGTGSAYDSLLEVVDLAAGSYLVALTQFANFFDPITGSFTGSGETNFGGRSAEFALDLLGVDEARFVGRFQVSEPAMLGMNLLALAALAALRSRRRSEHLKATAF